MSESRRFYEYAKLFATRRFITQSEILRDFEISPATFKRDMAKLRNEMNQPLVFDRDLGGYRVDNASGLLELPGVRFNRQELLALLTVHSLMDQLQPWLLGPTLEPLRERLTEMLRKQGVEPDWVAQRVRLVQAGKRTQQPECFETVAMATLERKRLRILHHNRERNEKLIRDISPQQLVHYRDNWYVDARCHLRRDIRCFGIDAIESAEVLDTPADEIDIGTLRNSLGASYGIFGGQPKDWAKVRFNAKRARWVANEEWHPQQRQTLAKDGSLELEFPYSDEREVLSDILSYGPDVEVIAPQPLKRRYKALAAEMAK